MKPTVHNFDVADTATLESCFGTPKTALRLIDRSATGIVAGLDEVRDHFSRIYQLQHEKVADFIRNDKRGSEVVGLMNTIIENLRRVQRRNTRVTEKATKLVARTGNKPHFTEQQFNNLLKYVSRYTEISELLFHVTYNDIIKVCDILGGDIPQFLTIVGKYDITDIDHGAIQTQIEKEAAFDGVTPAMVHGINQMAKMKQVEAAMAEGTPLATETLLADEPVAEQPVEPQA